MKLIADSGSTKTDWRIITDDNAIHQAKTPGTNPFYQTAEEISKTVQNELIPHLKPEIVNNKSEIFFYGTGCSNEEKCKIVYSALKKIFPKANIEVHHDLVGAARALCGHRAGIACILGTGSNSCYFDGTKIIKSIPSLGFILGDEGSGGYLGKRLIRDFFNNEMPENINKKFIKKYSDVSGPVVQRHAFALQDEILDKVYAASQPNVYLASFSKFLFHNLKEPYIFKLIYDGFSAFFDKNVCKYSNYKDYRVHFVGSIAFYYNHVLKQVAADKGVTIGNILESPIAGLTLFHQ